MTMLTASGQEPPRLAGRKLTRGVANQFIREHDSYIADMAHGGVVEEVAKRTAPIGQLLDAGQRQAPAVRYFGRGMRLLEGELRKGLMQMAEICDDVDSIDLLGLKMKLRKT